MMRRLTWFAALLPCLAASVEAQDPPPIRIEGEVPPGDVTHFFVPFEVPEGIVEIEVQHDDLSPVNILDWGLNDPEGFRGWGGGNTEPAIVGTQSASRSYVPGPIPAGTWEVVVGLAAIEEVPARYVIDIFLRTEATLPDQPRTPYEDPGVLDDEARWYAGDFHVHSRQSGDADPTLGEVMEVAEAAGLDFLMLAEHNTNSGLTLYGDVQAGFPDLLMVPGVEWTTYSGHGNAIGATEWVDHKIGVRGATAEGAIQAYLDQGALFSVNHPTSPGAPLCIGCTWEISIDPTTIDAVEVQSSFLVAIDWWEDLVANGSRAVPIGGSDDHDGGLGGEGNPLYRPTGIPATMVYAEELSVDAILDGIRSGRVVVKIDGVDGPMLETDLSGERVGDTVFADTSTLSAVVTGGEGLTLRVIKNGEEIRSVRIDSDLFMHEEQVTAPSHGEDRYRHQVGSNRDPRTVGSYVWLRPAQEVPDGGVPDGGEPDGGTGSASSGGCSCRVASPAEVDTTVLLALVFGFALARRRRGPG